MLSYLYHLKWAFMILVKMLLKKGYYIPLNYLKCLKL